MKKKSTKRAGLNGQISKGQRSAPSDVNLLAHHLGNLSTGEKALPSSIPREVSLYMASIGSKGGKVGGKKRLETMTQERRSQIAFKAAQARWSKKTKKP